MDQAAQWLAAGFSLMFFVSAFAKTMDFSGFVRSVNDFGVLPGRLDVPAAAAVTLAECVMAALFAANAALLFAYLASGAFMLLFAGLLLSVRVRRKTVQCRCFGPSRGDTNVVLALLRNAGILGLSLFGAYAANNGYSSADIRIGLVVPLALAAFAIVRLRLAAQRRRVGRAAVRWLTDVRGDRATDLSASVAILFLSIEDEGANLNAIRQLRRAFPKANLQVVYRAPAWKAKALTRKTGEADEIWADERGEISRTMEVREYPHYLLVNGTSGRIVETGSLPRGVGA